MFLGMQDLLLRFSDCWLTAQALSSKLGFLDPFWMSGSQLTATHRQASLAGCSGRGQLHLSLPMPPVLSACVLQHLDLERFVRCAGIVSDAILLFCEHEQQPYVFQAEPTRPLGMQPKIFA